jgi:hypothetical protein
LKALEYAHSSYITMLTGPDLLAKVKELGDVSKSDLVRSCGYVSTKEGGGERLNFTAFYEALLEAKGIATIESNHDSGDYLVEILEEGCLRIGIPQEVNINDSQILVLRADEFDPYLPGTPFSLIVEEKSNCGEPNLFLAPDESSIIITYEDLEKNCGSSFYRDQGYLAIGARFTIQPDFSEQFTIEPLVWTGIDADDEECARLLVIINQDVSPLLGLAADPCNEQLFDLDEDDGLEECISRCLRRAVELVVNKNPAVVTYLENRGVLRDGNTILKRLNKWLAQIDESGGNLELLRKDVSSLISLVEGIDI